MTPEDTIMELVDNVELLYNRKIALFDRWMKAGDSWREARARRQANRFGRQLARDLRDMDLIKGRYKKTDFEEFAEEVIRDFYEHREYVIKEAASTAPATPPDPTSITDFKNLKSDALKYASDLGADVALQDAIRHSANFRDLVQTAQQAVGPGSEQFSRWLLPVAERMVEVWES